MTDPGETAGLVDQITGAFRERVAEEANEPRITAVPEVRPEYGRNGPRNPGQVSDLG